MSQQKQPCIECGLCHQHWEACGPARTAAEIRQRQAAAWLLSVERYLALLGCGSKSLARVVEIVPAESWIAEQPVVFEELGAKP